MAILNSSSVSNCGSSLTVAFIATTSSTGVSFFVEVVVVCSDATKGLVIVQACRAWVKSVGNELRAVTTNFPHEFQVLTYLIVQVVFISSCTWVTGTPASPYNLQNYCALNPNSCFPESSPNCKTLPLMSMIKLYMWTQHLIGIQT